MQKLFIIFSSITLLNSSSIQPMYTKQQEHLNNQLFKAVSGPKELAGKVLSLLAEGVNPNIIQFDPQLDTAINFDNIQNTPLHIAIRNSYLDSALFLLDEKADVNAKNIEGSTPLHEAIYLGKKKTLNAIQILYRYNAHLDEENEDGVTPLSLALKQNKFRVAQWLIKLGANLNKQDKKGNTLLHKAVLENNVDVVRFLLRQNAQKDIKNKNNKTPFLIAANAKNFTLAFLLGPK